MIGKLLCFLGWHRWSYGLNIEHYVSERTCTRCNKRQWGPTFGGPYEWRDL